jgi:hypothetical protein
MRLPGGCSYDIPKTAQEWFRDALGAIAKQKPHPHELKLKPR